MSLEKCYSPPVLTAYTIYKRVITKADAPAGFEFTGEFRPPLNTEFFLAKSLRVERCALPDGMESPRYILRKTLTLAARFSIAAGDWFWDEFTGKAARAHFDLCVVRLILEEQ